MRNTILIGCSVIIAACGDKAPDIPPPESRPAKLMTVTVSGEAEKRSFPALVVADDSAVLTFRVPGQLKQMQVKAGMQVTAGQTLAVLDQQELKLQLAQAQASYDLAKVQFERTAGLRKDFVVSEQDYEQAESKLNEAIANRDQAYANLGYATLHAPYDGAISLRHKENHEYVAANEPVMNIQTSDIVNVSFQLPERLAGQINRKQQTAIADIVFDTYPDKTFSAMLKQIDTEADRKTGSYKVTLTLKRPENVNVLPGMSTTVIVPIKAAVSSLIPKSALIKGNTDQPRVWQVGEDGRVSESLITLNDDRLIGGLQDGDVIVLSGVEYLNEGDKVTPWVKERGL